MLVSSLLKETPPKTLRRPRLTTIIFRLLGAYAGVVMLMEQLCAPNPRIQLAATMVGSLSQIRCEGDDIDDIVINLLDGASSPGVTGLPADLVISMIQLPH